MSEAIEFRRQLEKERPYLLRYATLQLRDSHVAEDVVQEALLAALAGEASFAGRSNLRTWLTGILKHKLVDAIRRAAREPSVPVGAEDEATEFDVLFRRDGHWIEQPDAWEHPETALEQRQFLEILEQCLKRLPEKASRAFMMREHMGLETDELCKELAITPNHCWVLLYRARMALRQCLEQNWFAKHGIER